MSARTSARASTRRLRLLLVGLLAPVVLAAAGCTGLPTSGPIVETTSVPEVDQARPMGIDPDAPEPGASRAEIANGFLNAMKAWPRSFDVARSYLAGDAQAAWSPEQSTITYADRGPLTEVGNTVALRLVDPARLDEKGAWAGALLGDDSQLRLRMVKEDGEYRIVDPPDEQIVPNDWYAERFRRANLYFLDPTSRILVPEPVFVPVGEQLASTLVQRLLAGPPADGVTTTAFPSGLTVELSVPVSDTGVADIRLEGAPPPRSPDVVDRMLAQLAWTLGQEGITSIRLTISGQEMRDSGAPGGAANDFDVNSAPELDPAGYRASLDLYGLSEGRLVTGTRQDLVPVDGPLGTRAAGVRSVAIDLTGETVAAVSLDGTRLLQAPVSSPGDTEPGEITTLVDDASNLLPPVWDFDGRLWLVDRTGDGVTVSYIARGERREVEVEVPGVSGRQVRAFLVSRDGTRFVAVVRSRGVDQVRVGRILLREDPGVVRVLPTQPIEIDGVGPNRRIVDLAWATTTTFAALTPVVSGERYEVRTLGVDGAPTESDTTSVNGKVTGLVGSPAPGSKLYALTRASLFDVASLTSSAFATEVTWLTYAG